MSLAKVFQVVASWGGFKLGFVACCAAILFAKFAVMPLSAFAACSSPAGHEGDIVYNSTSKTVQFCNNLNQWISTAAVTSAEKDSTIGTLTSPDFCTTDGTVINCTTSQINLASQVTASVGTSHFNSGTSASSSAFWRGDGTWASPSFTETDPKIANNSLIATGACHADDTGSQVVCNTAPSACNLTLVGWYKFEEGSGTTTADSSPHYNNGTLVASPAWAAGKVGSYALSFNGSSQYVSLPDNDSLHAWEGSIAAWVKTTSDNKSTLFSATYSASSAANDGFVVEVGTNAGDYPGFSANPLITIAASAGGVGGWSWYQLGYTTATRSALFDGNWHHIAVVAAGGATKIYLDGVSQAISVSVGPVDGFFTASGHGAPIDTFVIGAGHTSSGYTRYFNGAIDDFRIYKGGLTDAQVSNLYNGIEPSCP